jgi:purine-nucleoside phosphorylase
MIVPRPDRFADSIDAIRSRTAVRPRIALVLGSGLGDFADSLPDRFSIPTAEIPQYPQATVEGHEGRIVFATVHGTPVVAFQGRIHFYESNDRSAVLYPIHVAHELGARVLVVTNAAGGVNRRFSPGDLMIICDQINMTMESGFLAPPSGVLNRPLYDPLLITKARDAARHIGLRIQEGVYAGMKGPSYETAAEVDMVYRLGADAVGMSTVLEVQLAAALEMNVLGISCITNRATGISTTTLNHQEVTKVANRVKHDFTRLLTDVLAAI